MYPIPTKPILTMRYTHYFQIRQFQIRRTAANQRSAGSRITACLSVVALTAVLAACESTPYSGPQQQPSPTVVQSSNTDALVALAQSASGDEAPPLWLAAAEALYQDGRTSESLSALAKVKQDELTQTQAFDFGALSTELALARFNGPKARAYFDDLLPVTPAQDLRFTELANNFQSTKIDPTAEARALIASPPPRSRAKLQQRSDQIWSLISQSPAPIVKQQAASTGGVERGWWQLKAQMLDAFTLSEATGRLTRWQSANSQHPANQPLPSQLSALQSNRAEFKHIALLIPQSGPLAAAGKAVRDGFVAAHLHAQQTPGSSFTQSAAQSTGRQITVLDTASASLPDLLAQAESIGADLLVGPLDKTRVAQLNSQPSQVPTLLLNYLPDTTAAQNNIVQFGLAVEDEARAIARRIQAEGLERVVVLHNEKEWSQRARDGLIKEFANAALSPESSIDFAPASQVVGVGSTPDVKQVTSVVGSTLLVDASSARHRRLERVIGEDLEFVPRARQDVDAIVAFLDGPEARALRPALRFHFSQSVPVYTSSQALRRVSKRDLRDLRGFNVSEIPWKLYPSPIKESVEASFGVTQGGLVPLYALGVDAYRLADRLDLLINTPHQRLLGGTGELSIEYGGRVRRDLAWQYVGSDGLTPLPMVMSER